MIAHEEERYMLCCSRNSLDTAQLLVPPKCKTFQDATYLVFKNSEYR